MLGFPRGQDPCSTKLYQWSILLGVWKHEFCFGSGRVIFNGRTDAEDEAPTLRPMMWRPSSLEETLMLGKIVGRRRGIKRMRRWDGVPDSMDMSLRKLQNSERQGSLFCCRTCNQRVRHDLATEQYQWGHRVHWRLWSWLEWRKTWAEGEASHSLVQVLESKTRSTRLWMFYLILFSKSTKSVFCRRESFNWVCTLDFTEGFERDWGQAESAKTRWPAVGGQGLW